VIGSDYGGIRNEQRHDQIVVNNGTLPVDELYFELKPHSSNRDAVDYTRLIEGGPQPVLPGFQLYRIGDAVAARNTHAAIYDALRLTKDL
jgi:hypothetical protein